MNAQVFIAYQVKWSRVFLFAPGQSCTLQTSISRADPTHVAPPWHVRVLSRLPPAPQVFEHALQADHSLQKPVNSSKTSLKFYVRFVQFYFFVYVRTKFRITTSARKAIAQKWNCCTHIWPITWTIVFFAVVEFSRGSVTEFPAILRHGTVTLTHALLSAITTSHRTRTPWSPTGPATVHYRR